MNSLHADLFQTATGFDVAISEQGSGFDGHRASAANSAFMLGIALDEQNGEIGFARDLFCIDGFILLYSRALAPVRRGGQLWSLL